MWDLRSDVTGCLCARLVALHDLLDDSGVRERGYVAELAYSPSAIVLSIRRMILTLLVFG